MKELHIYTYLYGEKFKEIFLRFCYPSMMQAGNIPKLISSGVQVKWYVYSNLDLVGLHPCCIYIPARPKTTADCFLTRAFKCANMVVPMAVVAPDYIMGDNTLSNAVRLLEGRPDGCIAVAHPRIVWEKITKTDLGASNMDMPNPRLVALAFEYGHDCLMKSFDNVVPNLTWAGIATRQISDKLYSVIHNLATPFICNFTTSDVKFFQNKHFGHFDRGFTKKLLSEGRVKLVGSSDVCFFVELTSYIHAPALRATCQEKPMLYNDKEMSKDGENHYNQFYVTWRKE